MSDERDGTAWRRLRFWHENVVPSPTTDTGFTIERLLELDRRLQALEQAAEQERTYRQEQQERDG